MIVGALRIELRVHGARSLKQKRGVLRSISARLRNRFHVSVAEIGGQDTWQRAELGVAIAASGGHVAQQMARQVLDGVEEMHTAEVVGSQFELLETAAPTLGFAALEDGETPRFGGWSEEGD